MRRVVAILAAAVCLPVAAHAQEAYAAILLEYLTGDSDAAIARLASLPPGELDAGVAAFDTTRSRLVLTGAAALHTELALGRAGGGTGDYHLHVATAIVEFGERRGPTTNTPISIRPQHAAPVSDEFRRLWYCTVINKLEGAALLAGADKYVAHALALYPDSGELQLLAGIADEMHASARVTDIPARDRRRALERAELHYREALARAPGRLEARLRLGRVLQQRDKLTEARTLLTPLTSATEDRLAYLASLFLGGIEDREDHAAAAAGLYDRAAARVPTAQTARLAASEIRHRTGDRQAAADAVPVSTGDGNIFDPWWTYVFGEYWRVDSLLDAIRRARRA